MFDLSSLVKRELGIRRRPKRTTMENRFGDEYSSSGLMPQYKDPNMSDYGGGYDSDLEGMLRGGMGGSNDPMDTSNIHSQDPREAYTKKVPQPSGTTVDSVAPVSGAGEGAMTPLQKLQEERLRLAEEMRGVEHELAEGVKDDDKWWENLGAGAKYGARQAQRGSHAHATPAGSVGWVAGNAVGAAFGNLFRGNMDDVRERQESLELLKQKDEAIKKEQERLLELEKKVADTNKVKADTEKSGAETDKIGAEAEDIRGRDSRFNTTNPVRVGENVVFMNPKGESVQPTVGGKPLTDPTQKPQEYDGSYLPSEKVPEQKRKDRETSADIKQGEERTRIDWARVKQGAQEIAQKIKSGELNEKEAVSKQVNSALALDDKKEREKALAVIREVFPNAKELIDKALKEAGTKK